MTVFFALPYTFLSPSAHHTHFLMSVHTLPSFSPLSTHSNSSVLSRHFGFPCILAALPTFPQSQDCCIRSAFLPVYASSHELAFVYVVVILSLVLRLNSECSFVVIIRVLLFPIMIFHPVLAMMFIDHVRLFHVSMLFAVFAVTLSCLSRSPIAFSSLTIRRLHGTVNNANSSLARSVIVARKAAWSECRKGLRASERSR